MDSKNHWDIVEKYDLNIIRSDSEESTYKKHGKWWVESEQLTPDDKGNVSARSYR